MNPVPQAPENRSLHDPAARGALSIAAIITLGLLVIGGLNWGLVGLFNFDLVALLFGPMSMASRAVYALVGIAAVFAVLLFPRVSRPL